jgi:hypothetical protein
VRRQAPLSHNNARSFGGSIKLEHRFYSKSGHHRLPPELVGLCASTRARACWCCSGRRRSQCVHSRPDDLVHNWADAGRTALAQIDTEWDRLARPRPWPWPTPGSPNTIRTCHDATITAGHVGTSQCPPTPALHRPDAERTLEDRDGAQITGDCRPPGHPAPASGGAGLRGFPSHRRRLLSPHAPGVTGRRTPGVDHARCPFQGVSAMSRGPQRISCHPCSTSWHDDIAVLRFKRHHASEVTSYT